MKCHKNVFLLYWFMNVNSIDIDMHTTHKRTVMLNLSLPVYRVRLDWLPLPCIASIRPRQLSCLGRSVGRASVL